MSKKLLGDRQVGDVEYHGGTIMTDEDKAPLIAQWLNRTNMAAEEKVVKVAMWYDLPSDLTDEEKLDVLQILLQSHYDSGNLEAYEMVKEWERVLSDKIAEKALLINGDNSNT